jgi:hypothetical protein
MYSEFFILLGLSLNIITFVFVFISDGEQKSSVNNSILKLNKSSILFTVLLGIGLVLQVIGAALSST